MTSPTDPISRFHCLKINWKLGYVDEFLDNLRSRLSHSATSTKV